MSIPVIDTLKPLGNFPVAKAENIDVSGTSLDVALASKVSATDLAGKVDKVSGKGLSTNDYTNADKSIVTSLSNVFTIVD